jgi:hypothetical protein
LQTSGIGWLVRKLLRLRPTLEGRHNSEPEPGLLR